MTIQRTIEELHARYDATERQGRSGLAVGGRYRHHHDRRRGGPDRGVRVRIPARLMDDVLDVLAVAAYGLFIAVVVVGAMLGLYCLSLLLEGVSVGSPSGWSRRSELGAWRTAVRERRGTIHG